MSTIDLNEILAFSVALARNAGDLILEGSEAIQSEQSIGEKKNSVDLVTQYDVSVEDLVRSQCAQAYPTFGLSVAAMHAWPIYPNRFFK
jgi:myo-inositol-1(or 4)-monophosphatase